MKYPKLLMSIVFGLGLSLASCLGASLAWAGDRAAVAAADPLGNINRLPAALEQTVGLLRTGLEADGFAVARGYWTLWGVNECKYPLQTLGYCYGNNPTAPYVLAVLPTWKDEYLDQRFHHIINEPLRNMSPTFRMDKHEALVIVAQLPPEARYFGIGTSVFTREIAFNQYDPVIDFVKNDPLLEGILYGVSPDPARRMLVSSIGNSTNNVVVKQQIHNAPWNTPAYIVVSSDGDMAAALTNALVLAGASPSAIFTEPVAPQLVRLGLDRSADDLFTYMRYSMPLDPVAGEQWRKELPLTILRIRNMSSQTYDNPFAPPTYTPRTANFDERTAYGGDSGDFAALQNAVRERWGQSGTLVDFFSAYIQLDLIGQHCLGYDDPFSVPRGPMDCLGDTQDADYQISKSTQIDNGEVVAVMGTLSTETGNATYTSLSVNWFPALVGIANIDDIALKGTAATFGTANSDKFYVYYVARDCTGLTSCREISKKLVPTGGLIKFIQRNYINPNSTTGPDPRKIVNPVALVFDGRNRP
ncbi:MAG: hypothetical protein P4K86_02235 [Terracidiphilus sp.]|nr:hypothetical protein [Terracidiphilus sp.]